MTENHELMEAPATDLAKPAHHGRQAGIEVASTRASQQVQAAMIVAQKFPRDETAAYNRVMQACRRKTLAEHALYAYPRGNQTVTGPSIRMAEVLAQAWGNIDFGVVEVEQRNGESTVEAYCWDLETNVRATKVFQVKHERAVGNAKHGQQRIVKLTDPRDIYEMCANQGARRLRASILAIIPGDVVEAAVTECEKTMAGNNTEPLSDRARKMVVAFADYGVTQEMIERRLGHRIETIIEAEMVALRKVYLALKDNMAEREQFFPTAQAQADASKPRTESLAEKLHGETPAPAPASAPQSDEPKSAQASEAIPTEIPQTGGTECRALKSKS
jgi:hypothetical protein